MRRNYLAAAAMLSLPILAYGVTGCHKNGGGNYSQAIELHRKESAIYDKLTKRWFDDRLNSIKMKLKRNHIEAVVRKKRYAKLCHDSNSKSLDHTRYCALAGDLHKVSPTYEKCKERLDSRVTSLNAKLKRDLALRNEVQRAWSKAGVAATSSNNKKGLLTSLMVFECEEFPSRCIDNKPRLLKEVAKNSLFPFTRGCAAVYEFAAQKASGFAPVKVDAKLRLEAERQARTR
jgi:hypothetical protein